MKKVAIITACLIIFTILAGFNYLLWDNMARKERLKESETMRIENQESIAFLLSEINKKDADIREIRLARDELQRELNAYDEILTDREEELFEMNSQLQDIYEEINHYILIVNALKKTVDNDYFINFLRENWANHLNRKQYFIPFTYQDSLVVLGDIQGDYNYFQNQFRNVTMVEIVGVEKVDISQLGSQEIEYIQYNAQLNITLLKEEDGTPVEDENFAEGENIFIFTFKYDTFKSTWIIDRMSKT